MKKINFSWIALSIISIIWIVPSIGILMASIRPMVEISNGWWDIHPFSVTFSNYVSVLTTRGIGKSFMTSLIITIPATVIPIFIYSLGAYAFSFLKFLGRKGLFVAMVSSFILPGQVALIPLLKLYSKVGLIDSYIGIILIHVAFCLGWVTLLFRNFFATTIPFSVIEAAKIDGCSDLRIFWNIVLPLSLPAVASVASLQFLWTWNDLLFPLVFLRTKIPLTVALTNLKSRYSPEWGLLSAGAIISLVIPLLIFIFLQKYLVKGLTAGAGK